MNRRGFTMIELLMVIVIIGILSAIMIPNIIVIMNKSNENNIKSLENNIIAATKAYVSDNKYTGKLNTSCPSNNITNISLSTLVSEGYIKNNIVNPNTKEKINENKTVTITFDCTKKTFTYSFSLE